VEAVYELVIGDRGAGTAARIVEDAGDPGTAGAARNDVAVWLRRRCPKMPYGFPSWPESI